MVRNTGFSKIKFRTINEVCSIKSKHRGKDTVSIGLDIPTHKKLKGFSIKNFFAYSEITRVLIENFYIKMNVRDRGTVQREGLKVGKINKNIIEVCLNKNLEEKLNKMRIENSTTSSEIVRHLINNTDLSKLKFKTKGEVYSVSNKEKNRKNRTKQQDKNDG